MICETLLNLYSKSLQVPTEEIIFFTVSLKSNAQRHRPLCLVLGADDILGMKYIIRFSPC